MDCFLKGVSLAEGPYLLLFRCPVGMVAQVQILKRVLCRMQCIYVTIFVHWVPSELQPANPLSRV